MDLGVGGTEGFKGGWLDIEMQVRKVACFYFS